MLQRVVSTMRLILIKTLFIFSLSLLLEGCETLKHVLPGDSDSTKNECSQWKDADNQDDDCVDWDAAKFSSMAKKALDGGNYDKAIKIYEALEARYPFGPDSNQTQLNIAYAYFKNGDHDAAISTADHFIKTNPRSPHVDYAYYLKGLVNYKRDIGFIDRYLPTDGSQRDPGSANEAYNIFSELLRRFPNSKYAPDVKHRMIGLKNKLAMHEVNVARYYMKRKAYVAAANRATGVVEKYQRTPAIPYALKIMQEAYTKLDMTELAKDAERIYQENFANAPPEDVDNTTPAQKVWDFIGLEQ
ncbi:Outer membrane protein assembly factor BamD [Crenothrix polyspora]|uniref:Outer membrane protein assembly factor BamD n=2 Tax=Crenothrix polyspora TaxID=360316 RepID=A0A1R4H750_9GAMM|nr:Outer membrane protein assembly factor BamD [Crenothrix polyspora]